MSVTNEWFVVVFKCNYLTVKKTVVVAADWLFLIVIPVICSRVMFPLMTRSTVVPSTVFAVTVVPACVVEIGVGAGVDVGFGAGVGGGSTPNIADMVVTP